MSSADRLPIDRAHGLMALQVQWIIERSVGGTSNPLRYLRQALSLIFEQESRTDEILSPTQIAGLLSQRPLSRDLFCKILDSHTEVKIRSITPYGHHLENLSPSLDYCRAELYVATILVFHHLRSLLGPDIQTPAHFHQICYSPF